jgi:hypothetical protein
MNEKHTHTQRLYLIHLKTEFLRGDVGHFCNGQLIRSQLLTVLLLRLTVSSLNGPQIRSQLLTVLLLRLTVSSVFLNGPQIRSQP